MPVETAPTFDNPFRPGAGHMPPYLAGRDKERAEFERLLDQAPVLENLVLTGLRGVGKTVLLDTLKPAAIGRDWHWVGTDLSESASVSEQALVLRLLADLSVVTSALPFVTREGVGFETPGVEVNLTFPTLLAIYNKAPGLVADKLKAVLEVVAPAVEREGKRGIIFAYDEAQTLADSPAADEFPLSLLLDVFQSIQRKGIPFMLVLTGLPTLFPKLVEARTFAERMFRVVVLDRLDREHSREAILRPIEITNSPVSFESEGVETICNVSGGYPYFIQFICREVFDAYLQGLQVEGVGYRVPLEAITQKLDTDFFAGRWAKATDRQRDLLWAAASLDNSDGQFTVQQIAAKSALVLPKPFGSSQVNQMLAALSTAGLIYKNRWGRYSFAVPMFDRFILRQAHANEPTLPS